MTTLASRILRTRAAGIDVILCPSALPEVVTLYGSLPAGTAQAGPDNPSLPALTGLMLDQGAAGRTKAAIAQDLEEVGASLSFSTGPQALEIRAQCLRPDVPRVLALLAAQLRQPDFPGNEFAQAKRQYLAALSSRLESVPLQAADAFSRAIYPRSHPNHRLPVPELQSAAQRAKCEEVRAFHARTYGPKSMTLVAVGAVDAETFPSLMENAFAGWTGGRDYVRSPAAGLVRSAAVERILLPDKPSIAVVLGQTSGVRFADAAYPALQLGTAILGSGFTGRLMRQVRIKQGLTYGIGAWLDQDVLLGGDWRISATFTSTLIDRGIAATRRECDRWFESGVTAAELDRQKGNFIGGFNVGLGTSGGLAAILLKLAQAGLELGWLESYSTRIRSLGRGEVNAAIRRHLDPANLTLVCAGTLP
jgi:zinc protease